MPREQTILLGVAGQSLTIDTPEGRPSAAVVAIYDPYLEEDDSQSPVASTTAATLTATIPAVNTTLAAAAAAGVRALTLTSGTGVTVGEFYRLLNVSGQSEIVEVTGASSTAITLAHPLEWSYPITTSTFVGIRTSVAIASSILASTGWLGDETRLADSYRVKWTLTIASATVIRRTYFDLVRIGPPASITVEDVLPLFPDLRELEWYQQNGKAMEPQLRWAEADVREALRRSGYKLDNIRGTNALLLLVGYRFRWLLAAQGKGTPGMDIERQVELWKGEYDRLLGDLRASKAPFAHDADDSGTLSQPERNNIPSRFVR